MVGQAPKKNSGKRSLGGQERLPSPQRLQSESDLEKLANRYRGLDLVTLQAQIMRSNSTKSTGGGDVSGSGHDGSSAGGTGIVPGSNQASNTGNKTGPNPKPPGPGIGGFANAVSRGGKGQTSSGGAGIAPGSSQVSITDNTRHTGSNPKPSGSGIGNFAPVVRHGGRDRNSSVKGKSSGGISKEKYDKDKHPKGNGQQSQASQALLTWVQESSEEVYFDEKTNRVAKRLVNNSIHGGHQERIGSIWHDSIRGNVTSMEDVAELFTRGTQMYYPEVESFYVVITPVDDDHFNSVKANATRSSTTSSNGRDREGKVAIVPQFVTREPAVSRDECVICGKPSHDFTMCLKAPKGIIVGCPVCSSRDHKLDDCQAFNVMSLAEKVNAVVTQRGNMPAILSSKPWHMWLHEYCNSPGFAKTEAITAFPWSKQFAIKLHREQVGKKLPVLQASFDADPLQRELLPQDNATCSYEAIWKTYWKPAKLPWPQAIGDLDVKDEEMSDSQDDDEDEGPVWAPSPSLPIKSEG
jgi:hypothetical protein